MATSLAELTGPSPAVLQEVAVTQGAASALDVFDNHPWFKTGADWTAWRAFLAAVYGLPMTEEEYAIYCECTGRKDAPTRQVEEAWMVVGRRGRKSAIGAFIGAFHSTYRDWRPHLAPKESARCLVMSKDKDEAQQIHTYAAALLTDPAMDYLLDDDPARETITLKNQTHLHIRAASLVGGRSRACHCALLDEVAFWPTKESSTPDVDIVRGIKPSMANMPGSLLVAMSSPYAQRGLLFENYELHYGQENPDILVWKAPTLRMHNTVAISAYVKKEYEKDPVGAAAEVGGEFRKDVKGFISREVVRALTVEGRHELGPCDWKSEEARRFTYFAFVDTTGGSQDSFSLAVGHWDKLEGKAVLDLVREWAPSSEIGKLDVEETVNECAGILKPYRLFDVQGDRYAGVWPRERFEKAEVKGKKYPVGYVVCERSKHNLYRDLLPALNSGKVELLDNPILFQQLVQLERKITPTGQERIDHPPGSHDDVVNAAAGVLLMAYDHGMHLGDPAADKKQAMTTGEILEEDLQESIREETERHQDTVYEEKHGELVNYDRWQY